MSERKEKFTPGPWRIAKRGNLGNTIEADSGKRGGIGAGLPDEGYRTVAMFQSCCSSENYYEQEANAVSNAHLIAAAPELYEALTEAVKTIDRLNDALAETKTWSDRNWDRVDNSAMRHKALLAKARGEA